MSYQFSVAARNGAADGIEASIGATPILKIVSGAPPADCTAADSGTVLATVNLPADWMANASGGSKSKLGTWEDLSADATGKPSHFRIYDSAGTTCHWQGLATGPWLASTNYALGDHVLNGGNVYKCTTAGVSASSGGPSGTGAGIADGSAAWIFVQAGADMQLDTGILVQGQDFQVSNFTLTTGGA